jgi:hypothetical protein
MNKPLRALTLASVLSLAFTTTLLAENMGTNPKPQRHSQQLSVLKELYDTITLYLGL